MSLRAPERILHRFKAVADAVASFTKMVAGYLADKFGHRKFLVLVDYGLTPLSQALIAFCHWLAADPDWPHRLVVR